MSGDFNKDGTRQPDPELAPGELGGRRLPPPAFPPGARRITKPREEGDPGSVTFISPDDPIPDRSERAFIPPDAPILRRPPRTASTAAEAAASDGVATGMGDDAHVALEELTLGVDPHVREVVDKVAKLAEALKQKGEAGLKATPDMTRFEVVLRSYCVGYLAGRRAGDEEG